MAYKTQTSAGVLVGLQKASEPRGMEKRLGEAEKAGELIDTEGWGSLSGARALGSSIPVTGSQAGEERRGIRMALHWNLPSLLSCLPTVLFLTSWLLFSNAF